ncbi:MAG: helix-hairpin-helix domain-containing protein [Promethearchaeota archaeon]
MESNKKIVAMVISPAKDAHKRKAKGFSLGEIQEAGKTVELLRKLNVDIDYFRKSKHENNIEKLRKLKDTSKKAKKKKPYEAKEKKRTPFKPKVSKPKKETVKKVVIEKPAKPTKATKKASAPKKEKVKKEPKTIKKELPEGETTSLTSLSGLGPATAKKFEELGVSCAEELVDEDPAELAKLIKGVSEERIKNWIKECKESQQD